MDSATQHTARAPQPTDHDAVSVALVPDRFAGYRYSIFKRLSDFGQNGFWLTIYADTEEDIPGLKLVDAAYCDRNYANGGISWVRIRNHNLKRICFWQSGLIGKLFSSHHNVHVYWGEAQRVSTWISAVLSRLQGKRVVFWTHGVYGNEGFLKGLIRRSFYRLADCLLLYGDYSRQLLLQHGFKEDKLYVIKNSLDVRRQDELYTESGERARQLRAEFFPAGERVLVFVGRLSPQKRLGMLLEALRALCDRGAYSYKLLIIGDGSERHQLEAQARELGIEQNVVFYGACYDDAVLAPLLMMADVCVSPGEVGLTAMHSLVFGTPVVSHDNFAEQMPEFEAITPSASGDFYRYGDLKDLCLKVENVLEWIDSGTITPETCRENIFKYYNEEYQSEVFKQMLADLSRSGRLGK